MAGGNPFIRGSIKGPDVGPGEEKIFLISPPTMKPRPGVEYFFDFHVVTNQSYTLIPKGYEIASEQIQLPFREYTEPYPHKASLEITWSKDKKYMDVTGVSMAIKFNTSEGTIVSWNYEGKELITQGPLPNYWRAPVDNDFGNRMQKRLAIWKEASKNRMAMQFKAWQPDPRVIHCLVIYTLKGAKVTHEVEYIIMGTGDIIINSRMDPGKAELPELPRFGMNFRIPEKYDRVKWYGKGPFENYWDRSTAAMVGVYESTVDDLYYPYVRPQENGTRTDVRWVALTSEDGEGLLVTGDPYFSFSALPFTIDDLDYTESRKKHTADLVKNDFIDVNVDYRQMGVGGNNSWGARPLQKYTLYAQPLEFSFKLSPLTKLTTPERKSIEKYIIYQEK
jgi:beta-galactosidase